MLDVNVGVGGDGRGVEGVQFDREPRVAPYHDRVFSIKKSKELERRRPSLLTEGSKASNHESKQQCNHACNTDLILMSTDCSRRLLPRPTGRHLHLHRKPGRAKQVQGLSPYHLWRLSSYTKRK